MTTTGLAHKITDSPVGEPDLYGGGLDALLAPDLVQARGKAFLKSSIAPSACS